MEKKKKIMIFEIGILIFITKIFLEITVFFKVSSFLNNCLVCLACVTIMISYWRKRYSEKRLLFIILSTFILAFFSKKVDNYYFFISWLIICRIDKNNFQKIIKLIYKTELFFMLIIIFISILFLFFNYKVEILFSYRRGVKALNFGFIHPNMFSIILANITSMWIWLNYKNINMKSYIKLIVIYLFGYLFTKTRTSFLIEIFLLINIYLVKNFKNIYYKNKILLFFSSKLFLMIGILILLLTNLYIKNNNVAVLVDKIITGRLHLSAYALINYKYTFLGQFLNFKVKWDPVFRLESFTFDCLYSQLFFNFGIIWFMLLNFSFFKISKKLDEKSKLLLIVWYLYGITEVHGLLCFFGFQILFLSFIFKVIKTNTEKRD